MLFACDSKTGDSPAYEHGGCEACHDGTQAGATKSVKTELNKNYAHPTHTYSDRHSLPEDGTSFEPANRHAECVDCHNPHTAGNTLHTAGSNAIASNSPLYGAWGVEPTWPSNWAQPVTFTETKPSDPSYPNGADYEYQVCFKCHSNYGQGTVTNAESTITDPLGSKMTDQAWEFNKNNNSFHPVVSALGAGTGSTNQLSASQMANGWSPGDVMTCSDCHNTNDAVAAQGPHGSTVKWMLAGTNKAWPYTSASNNGTSSGTFRTLNSRSTSLGTDNGLFCRNCHTVNTTSHIHGRHNNHEDRPCVGCHIRVPHGGKVSRLIATDTGGLPARYKPDGVGGGTTYVDKFEKATDQNSYNTSDCYSNVGSCYRHNNSGNGNETW
jgi:hypothetical protein